MIRIIGVNWVDYKLNNREIANIVQLAYIESGGNPNDVKVDSLINYSEMRTKFK
jgi:hypothetical protein